MASPVAITIESEDRAGFGSSLNSQRSYGTVKVSSAAFTSAGRLGSYVMHTVHEEDTLQGLALKYNVSVHHIQRLNNLYDSETIHSRTALKIPITSSSSSPKSSTKRLEANVASSSHDNHIEASGEIEPEEEVKRKPSARMKHSSPDPYKERSIASLLRAADEQIADMHRFNEKLAQKTAHLKQPADTYNRPRPLPRTRVSLSPSPLSNHSNTPSPHSSMEIIAERGKISRRDEERRRRMAIENSESLSNSRDTIEDHIFEL